jgi:hypothetical protein
MSLSSPDRRRDTLRVLAVLTAVILTTATIGVAVTMAATATTQNGVDYALDDSTRLTTQDAVQEFDSTGSVTANVSTPALSITIAESASACGYESSVLSDTRNDYLCLDYQEDVAASIRLHVPGDYWHPYVRQDKASVRGDAPASFEVRDDGNATVVTADFEEATHAIYPIPEDVTASYFVLDNANERSKSWLGIDILGHSTSWQPIDDSALSGDNTSTRLVNERGDLLIQYDSTPNQSEATWLTVPSDPGDSAPVYRMTKNGDEDAVYVVSETTDAPPVRYKSVSGVSQQLDAALRQIAGVDDKLESILNDAFGGLFGGAS